MKIISWNIRGTNEPQKKIMLRKKICMEKPTILILQESKCSEIALKEKMQYIWKGSNTEAIDAIGTVGGMALIWDPSRISLKNLTKTPWFITADFNSIDIGIEGVLTGVYGPSTPLDKGKFLDSLMNTTNRA